MRNKKTKPGAIFSGAGLNDTKTMRFSCLYQHIIIYARLLQEKNLVLVCEKCGNTIDAAGECNDCLWHDAGHNAEALALGLEAMEAEALEVVS